MWHFLSCALAAAQVFIWRRAWRETREKMVVLVERQTDQRRVISIGASHQDRVSERSLPLHCTPRDGSLLCLRESVSGKGQPVHGSHIRQAQAGAQTNHVAGTSKMRLEIPRTLSAKHET